jgi:pimeloyl-ACP methyl ester carboxylesterase
MDTIDVDGLRIAHERAGDGPLLHGYVGDGRATWRGQIDALSDEFTVIAWDAPGAGRSSDPPEAFDLAGYGTAWPGLSRRSAWRRRMWPGCPLAASSRSALPPAPRHPEDADTGVRC